MTFNVFSKELPHGLEIVNNKTAVKAWEKEVAKLVSQKIFDVPLSRHSSSKSFCNICLRFLKVFLRWFFIIPIRWIITYKSIAFNLSDQGRWLLRRNSRSRQLIECRQHSVELGKVIMLCTERAIKGGRRRKRGRLISQKYGGTSYTCS